VTLKTGLGSIKVIGNVTMRILLEIRIMEVVVTTGAKRHAKLQSNHHHQQTSIQLFTGRMPFLSPNQQCPSSEEKESWNRFLCLVWFIIV